MCVYIQTTVDPTVIPAFCPASWLQIKNFVEKAGRPIWH